MMVNAIQEIIPLLRNDNGFSLLIDDDWLRLPTLFHSFKTDGWKILTMTVDDVYTY